MQGTLVEVLWTCWSYTYKLSIDMLDLRLSTPGAFSKSWTMNSVDFAGESGATEPAAEPAPEPSTKRELFMTPHLASKKARPTEPPVMGTGALRVLQASHDPAPKPAMPAPRPPPATTNPQVTAQMLAMPVNRLIPVPKIVARPPVQPHAPLPVIRMPNLAASALPVSPEP